MEGRKEGMEVEEEFVAQFFLLSPNQAKNAQM